MTATIRTVARPRGTMTASMERRLRNERETIERAQANYRGLVVLVLDEGASFSEVARVTGLSTNTLQRWKREAGGVR